MSFIVFLLFLTTWHQGQIITGNPIKKEVN